MPWHFGQRIFRRLLCDEVWTTTGPFRVASPLLFLGIFFLEDPGCLPYPHDEGEKATHRVVLLMIPEEVQGLPFHSNGLQLPLLEVDIPLHERQLLLTEISVVLDLVGHHRLHTGITTHDVVRDHLKHGDVGIIDAETRLHQIDIVLVGGSKKTNTLLACLETGIYQGVLTVGLLLTSFCFAAFVLFSGPL